MDRLPVRVPPSVTTVPFPKVEVSTYLPEAVWVKYVPAYSVKVPAPVPLAVGEDQVPV